MIDLRYRDLPEAIDVDGEVYAIETDFRVWIAWMESLEVNGVAEHVIFKGRIPPGDSWVEDAIAFATNPVPTPQGGESDGSRAYDFVADGDYLVGAFQQAYGIDLTSCSMHWHRFLALFRSLPDDTVMARAMAYRTYRKTGRSHDDTMADARRAWALPPKQTPENRDMLQWQEQAFGSLKP